MKKNMYCTLDCETVGGCYTPKGMYNLGAVIHDKDGNIFATTSLLIMEHYDKIRHDDYAKNNFHLYEERLKSGEMSGVATESEAVSIVRNLCNMYSVRYIMAYNTEFDLTKTVCRELVDNDDFEFIDLYLMAMQTVVKQRKYANFCLENGFRSRSGKSVATTAESVYAFFVDDPYFEEEHTALNDALIEMEIFRRCYKMHKKFTKNAHRKDTEYKYNGFPKWDEEKGKRRPTPTQIKLIKARRLVENKL